LIGFQFFKYDVSVKQYKQCEDNCKKIGTALEMYSTDNSGRYPEKMDYLIPAYLSKIPDCPAAGKDTYSAGYQGFR
jgi:hypothetical protein